MGLFNAQDGTVISLAKKGNREWRKHTEEWIRLTRDHAEDLEFNFKHFIRSLKKLKLVCALLRI